MNLVWLRSHDVAQNINAVFISKACVEDEVFNARRRRCVTTHQRCNVYVQEGRSRAARRRRQTKLLLDESRAKEHAACEHAPLR